MQSHDPDGTSHTHHLVAYCGMRPIFLAVQTSLRLITLFNCSYRWSKNNQVTYPCLCGVQQEKSLLWLVFFSQPYLLLQSASGLTGSADHHTYWAIFQLPNKPTTYLLDCIIQHAMAETLGTKLKVISFFCNGTCSFC